MIVILKIGTVLFLLLGGLAYWPLMLLALILMAWFDYYVSTLCLGILLDLAYGMPPVHHILHSAIFLYTLTAMLFVCLAYLGKNFTSAGERRIRVGR
jgi:hypothetical protein